MADYNKIIGGLAGGASMAASAIQTGMQMAQLPEDEEAQQDIDNLYSQYSTSSSMGDLQNLFDSTKLAKTNYTYQDVIGMSGDEAAGSIAASTLGQGAQGAQVGMGIGGPFGAAIGGLVGLVGGAFSSGFGWLSRKNKATAEANRLNKEGKYANNVFLDNFNNSVENAMEERKRQSLLNIAAFGGPLYINDFFTNGVRKIENGGTHEQNPLSGVPMGIAADGLENLVEEGELIYNDYVFSQRLMVPEASKAILGLSKKKDYTFAEAADALQKESEERPNDPISKRTLDEMMGRLQESQETVKAKKEAKRLRTAYNKLSPLDKMNLAFAMQPTQSEVPMFAKGGHLFPLGGPVSYAEYKRRNPNYSGTEQEYMEDMYETYGEDYIDSALDLANNPASAWNTTEGKVTTTNNNNTVLGNPFAQALRASSVFGSLAGAVGSLFDKPNYSNIERAERAMAAVPRVSAGHVGQRLTYTPIDINYLMAQTANQGIGARRALVESGAGPQAIIAGNYGTQTAMGQNLLAALAQNEARKAQVAEFNRGTETTNIGNDLQAALANQRRDLMGANFLLETAPMKNAELATVQNNRSVQLTNAFNQLHNLGTDIMNRDMAIAMAQSYGVPYNPYMLQAMGTLGYRQSKEGEKLNTKKEGGKHA